MYKERAGLSREKGLGHTCGVRVDGTSSRRFLRFLSLTALRAEGGGGALRAQSFIIRLRRSRQHRVSILSAYLVHPFPLRGISPQGETRALRDWLSVSYGMISILVIGSLRSPPKGENAGIVHEIYDSLFFLSILLVSP